MSVNLTTRFLFKQFAGVSVTTHDTVIDRLIADVCELIAKACNRTFESTTYKEWLDGNGESRMLLSQWPITRVYKITSDSTDVLDIKFTGDGTHADVTVDATNCVLNSISNLGVATSTDVVLADSKIVSALAAAIEVVTGWTTSIASGCGDEATLYLKPLFGEDALSPDEATLCIPGAGAGVRLVSKTNRGIESKYGYEFPYGRSNIFCWFTAGYTLPVDNAEYTALATDGNVPGGLTNIANTIINSVFRDRKKSLGMKSEHIGDYSYTRETAASAIKQNWGDLQMYARIGI